MPAPAPGAPAPAPAGEDEMFSVAELEYLSNLSKTPNKDTLDAIYTTLVNFIKYIDEDIAPVLAGQLSLKPKEKAILEVYTRIKLWVKTIIKLNNFYDFQGNASALRSVFELYLDLHLLERDIDEKLTRQYFDYAVVERYRSVSDISAFNKKHPELKPDALAEYILQSSFNQQDIINTIERNWGSPIKNNGKINFPKHWTNKTRYQVAKDLGPEFESLYLDIYPKLSWFVHSDPTGYQRMNDFVSITLLSYIYLVTLQLLEAATIICAKEFRITQFDPKLKDKLLFAKAEFLTILVELSKKTSTTNKTTN